jgi:NNP family nitrate/nitrite transporter-like MFS transporter
VATPSHGPSPRISLLVAILGYALTLWAWSLAGPLHGGTTLTAGFAAVIAGSLGRLPVGVLTDRYGARAVLPAISVLAAVAVLLSAVVGPILFVAVLLGVGGTSFAAGAAVVIRAYPRGKRGVRLAVFGAGMGVASAAAVVTRLWVTVDRRTALPLLALALIGHAVLAAVLLRDPVRARPQPRAILELLRLPAIRYLSAWYAVAFGGLIAVGLYLPAYLRRAHDLPAEAATLITAACLIHAAACRPLGGWLCRRYDPVRLLSGAFAGAGAAVLALALHPGLPTVTALIAVLAACLGTASGTVQAIIGDAAPPRRAGTVAGTIGAIGGLAGVLPPLVLATTAGVSGTYGVGLTLLAGVVTVTAWQLYHRGPAIGAVLAFPDATTDVHETTVVVVTPTLRGGQADLASTVAVLADLAARHELVVVAPTEGGGRAHTLVAGLREHLPRHHIVGITTGARPHPHETRFVAELLQDGVLPVIEPGTVHAELAAMHVAAALGTTDVLHPFTGAAAS